MKTRVWFSVPFVFTILAFSQTGAQAQSSNFVTGNDLVTWMREYEKEDRDPGSNFLAALYMGYVRGVVDGYRLASAAETIDLNGVTSARVNTVVAKYLKNHPEHWNYSAEVLVMDALKDAFPVTKGKGVQE